jgi:hypothetical protein
MTEEWESEEKLCQAFIDYAKGHGWTIYPEQGSWDILLVRKGIQIGVQAKKVASVHMLLQALPTSVGKASYGKKGPQYRAVLYGRASGRTEKARREHNNEIIALAMRLRLLVIKPPLIGQEWVSPRDNASFSTLGRFSTFNSQIRWKHYHWRPEELEWVPPFVPDLPAGVPSPQSVGPWKIAAIKMEQLHDECGFVCLTDAREVSKEVEGTWNAKTLLSLYFRCTGKRVEGCNQMKWVLKKTKPSDLFPEVAKEMMQ